MPLANEAVFPSNTQKPDSLDMTSWLLEKKREGEWKIKMIHFAQEQKRSRNKSKI